MWTCLVSPSIITVCSVNFWFCEEQRASQRTVCGVTYSKQTWGHLRFHCRYGYREDLDFGSCSRDNPNTYVHLIEMGLLSNNPVSGGTAGPVLLLMALALKRLGEGNLGILEALWWVYLAATSIGYQWSLLDCIPKCWEVECSMKGWHEVLHNNWVAWKGEKRGWRERQGQLDRPGWLAKLSFVLCCG